MKKVFLFLFVQSCWTLSFAQLNTAEIDSIFSEWDHPNSPGCALGIFEKGEIIYAKGYGSANLEYGIPNSSNSVFRIGSTSKQFTAACIVLLQQQGKLNFEDAITDFFPTFPEYAKHITVRQLLNHTSGLRDYLALSYLKGLGNDDFYTDDDIMRWMVNQKELNFEPGSEFVYCNSGYWLLGQIVNEVTGQTMAEYADEEIFTPLGMENTHFHNDHTEIVPNRASGYLPKGEEAYRISMTTLDMIGDGGIFTTIEDIKLWDDAFYESSVLNKDFWVEMTRQGKLNDGEEIDYASGLFLRDYEGLKTIRHGGAFVGFRAELLRFPEQQVTIAIFANRGDARPSRMANRVADVLLSDLFVVEEETEDPDVIPINEEDIDIASFVGEYEIRTGMILKVSLADDSVHVVQSWDASEYNLIRLSANTYGIEGEESLSFHFGKLEERYTQILEVNQGGRKIACERKEPFDESAINLTDYIGVYYSSELEVDYSIEKGENGLELSINQLDPMEITPDALDHFFGENGELNFIRTNDKITGFRLDAGRVKNLFFEKK